MNKLLQDLGLPEKIKVKVIKGKANSYVAELPEYNIHTESDSLNGLDFMINDLIYAYFDVPKSFWGKIFYRKHEFKPESPINLQKLMLYQQFISSNICSSQKG